MAWKVKANMALEVMAQYGLEIRANMALKIRANLVRKSGPIWPANPGQFGLEIEPILTRKPDQSGLQM